MTFIMPKFGPETTIGEKYDPIFKIEDQALADAYFEACVLHTMSFGKSREEAENVERANFGYYAGYGTYEDRQRIEKVFRCFHPIFGAAA